MCEFLMIVAANFVAYALVAVIAIAVLYNKHFIKFVAKKSMDMAKVYEEEFKKLVEEEEEL